MPAIVPKPIMILADGRGSSGITDAADPPAPTPHPQRGTLWEGRSSVVASPLDPGPVSTQPAAELSARREEPANAAIEAPRYALVGPISEPVPIPPESARAVWAEMVEAMRLPEGLTEDMLPPGETPRAPSLVRVAMTRLSRELGRDYRLWYGTAMKVDSSSIELMQRHLRRRFAEVQRDQKAASKLDAELTRHGALLSEILARRLGAEWVEIPGDQPGDWAMSVPPGTRVWPVWRMYNFFRQRRDTDELAAFYADLQMRRPLK